MSLLSQDRRTGKRVGPAGPWAKVAKWVYDRNQLAERRLNASPSEGIWKATHKQSAPKCLRVGLTQALVEMQAWGDGKHQLYAELLGTDSTQSMPVYTGKPESAPWDAEAHLCSSDPREQLTVLLVGSDLYLSNLFLTQTVSMLSPLFADTRTWNSSGHAHWAPGSDSNLT